MQNNILNIIIKLENKWLSVLNQNLTSSFSHVHIPSHDQSHHVRVWSFARQLLLALEAYSITFTEKEIETLLICVFFHDIGMTKDAGPNHGKISSIICKDFFSSHPEMEISNLTAIFQIIENHDDKEYHENRSDSINISTLLSVCDDLDALGTIGVYRYAEIYLLRGVNISELVSLVLRNGGNRYRNFFELFNAFDNIIQQHEKRYLKLKDFYTRLQNEADHSNTNCNCGAIEVINLIEKIIIREEKSLEFLVSNSNSFSDTPYVIDFFNLLKDELESFNN